MPVFGAYLGHEAAPGPADQCKRSHSPFCTFARHPSTTARRAASGPLLDAFGGGPPKVVTAFGSKKLLLKRDFFDPNAACSSAGSWPSWKIFSFAVETGNRNSFVCADIAEPYAHNVACPPWHLSCPRKPKTARHRSRGHQEHPRDERFNAVTTSYSPSSQAPASPRNRCSKKNRQFGISTFYFSCLSLQPLKTNATRHPSSLTPS